MAKNDDDEIPEANDPPWRGVSLNQLPPLLMGEPFAMAGNTEHGHNAELLDKDEEQGVPGSFASMACDCGAKFRVNLLKGNIKTCPGCKTMYSHMLVVAAVGDNEVLGHVMEHILEQNGLHIANPEDDDDDEEGEGEDDDQDEDEDEK